MSLKALISASLPLFIFLVVLSSKLLSIEPDSLQPIGFFPNGPLPADEIIVGCEYGTSTLFGQNIRVFNLGEKINTDFAEYNQVLNQEEGFMLFTARRDTTTGEDKDSQDGQYFEDIMISQRLDGQFNYAKKLEDAQDLFPYSINTKRHEAPVFLSWDEDRLIIFKKDKLWYSDLSDTGYVKPVLYDGHVNVDKYQRHASFTENGKSIYFSSEVRSPRPGDFHFDLFVTHLKEDGNWTKPEPLGAPINTFYNEDSPEISRDGRSMYFSSSKPGGFGGYDIYYTTLVDDKWTEPLNLCEPINSPAQDIYFKPARNGTTAYFSSDRLGGFGAMDIYKVVLDIPQFVDCRDYLLPTAGDERYLVMGGTDTVLVKTPFVIEGRSSTLGGKSPNNWYWKIDEKVVRNTSSLEQIIKEPNVFEVSMEISVIDELRLEPMYACVTRKFVAVRPEDYQGQIAMKGVELSNLMSDNEIMVELDNQLTTNSLSLKNDVYQTQKNTRINVNVLENDVHPRELELSVTSTSKSGNGNLFIRDADAGDAVYTPNKDFVGVDQFKYIAEDTEGQKSEAFVIIKVLDEEQLMAGQMVANDYGETPQETPIALNILTNDSSYSGTNLKVKSVGQPSNGTVEIVNAETGEIRYTPNEGYSGTDAFTYTAIGEDGKVSSALVKISIGEVKAIPGAAPIASTQNDLKQIREGETAVLNLFDNDELKAWPDAKLTNVQKPSNGSVKTLDVDNGKILYAPNGGFTGTESFTYTVTNSNGESIVEGVTIIVLPDERLYALKLEPDFDETMSGQAVQTNLLANDEHQQGLAMKLSRVGTPANGSVEIVDAENGWVKYTPNDGFTGKDNFSYSAVDELGTKARALATITVTSEEEALLLLADDFGETREAVALELNLTENDKTFDGTSIELVELGEPQNGKARIVSSSKGTILYTPNIGFVGTEQFIYTAKDGKGNVATATVVIIVKPAVSMANVETTNLPDLALQPIYFNFDKDYIRQSEMPTMTENIKILKENPDLIIKVLSHCDSRGTKSYNVDLSDRRARNTVDYLINNGISKERIIASVGFGETQLVNDCGDGEYCPPADHQLNRRSDFVIVGRIKE